MRPPRASLGILACAALFSACGGSETPPGSSSETTAALLAEPVSDGNSTSVRPSSGPTDGPRIPVAELGYNHGDAEAIVKVVELSDFGCGYCRRFHDETFPTLRAEFIETGMVEWKFMPYVTGMFANSPDATEASECVLEQDAREYETLVERLWTEQAAWKNVSDPEPVLRGWVRELDVDGDRFDSCLAENRRTDRIDSATSLARQLGVRGTPTFVVIGYPPIQGALELGFFQQILSAVHAEETQRRAAAEEGDTGS